MTATAPPAVASTTPPVRARAVPPVPASAVASGAAVLGAVGWAAVWLVLELGDLLVARRPGGGDPQPSAVRVVATVALGMVVTTAAWWLLRRARRARRTTSEPLVLALGGLVLAGTGTALLHGTRWGMDALYSDAGFRTETVTRFADSPALADYAYRGLPAYYPPLWPWLQGRAADLLGLPGWAVMKPAQLLACLLVPVLSWLLWRRVVPGRRAAWVASVVAVATALPLKPDEWLVLVLVVPWWLEVCRGVVVPGRRRVGPVGHGVVLGLLLLTHTYFFAPLALATALGMVVDLLRRRPVHPRLGPGIVTALVALVLAAPSWAGTAWLRLHGQSSDGLQLRWSPPGFERPPLPWPTDPRGVLEAVGVLWLLWALRRSRLAGGLLVALVAAYVFLVGGQLLQPLGVTLLPEKTDELVEALLAAAGVLGAAALLQRRAAWLRARPLVAGVALAAVAAVGVVATTSSVYRGVGRQAAAAQHVRYPDGGFPAGGMVPPSLRWHAWGIEPGDVQSSVADVDAAWQRLTGRRLDAGDVVVSSRSDVPATLPVHLFISWKSIYSHPQGRFAERLEVLERLERCSSPECAYTLLVDNGVESVDGLVLNRDERGLYVSVTVDTFPEGWERRTVRLDERLLVAPWFTTQQVRRGLVVRVTPVPGG